MACDLERKYNELLIKFQQLDHDKFWNDVIPVSKIEEEIKELKNMAVGGETFITAVNFAIKILEDLLKEKGY